MQSRTLSDILRGGYQSIPYTYQQAENICRYFQYLINTAFDDTSDKISPIRAVLITPYEKYAKKDFIEQCYPFVNYTQLPNSHAALYDVVIVAHYKNDKNICLYKEISVFAMDKAFSFNPDYFL